MATRPSTPKGTRDFGPAEMRKRDYLLGTLRTHFERFGYSAIETPAMENLDTLTGKYGDEGDQLLFKVLNNGDFLGRADADALDARDSRRAVASLSKRGLRYDLTVPFARYVVQHRHEIALPFKRYAIQPVWRADRPQKGRYQEFYQCDADVVGSDSPLYEAELIRLYDRVFTALGLAVEIRVNHRDILFGLCERFGFAERAIEFVTTLDKLDKVGPDAVVAELVDKGFDADAAAEAISTLAAQPSPETVAQVLATAAAPSARGTAAVTQLTDILALVRGLGLTQALRFDPTLARGLSYYTGCIFEVVVDTTAAGQADIQMGSIGGGGRYANLTEAFGGRDLSGVGISFGAERMYDVLEELGRWPAAVQTGCRVLLVGLDETSLRWAFAKTDALRAAGIAADCYPEVARPKKPLSYANQAGIPFAILVGEREREAGTLALKDLRMGEQHLVDLAGAIARLAAPPDDPGAAPPPP